MPQSNSSLPGTQELLQIICADPIMDLPRLYALYPDIPRADINSVLLHAVAEIPHIEQVLAANSMVLLNTMNLIELERSLHRMKHVEAQQGSSSERRQSIDLAMAERETVIRALPPLNRCLAQVLALAPRDKTPSFLQPREQQSQTIINANGKLSRYTIQNDAIFRNLPRLEPELNEVYVGRARIDGSLQDVTTVVNLSFDNDPGILVEGNRLLTSYDKAILNGVSSLMLAEATYFTLPMLYRAMTGVDNPTLDAGSADRLRQRLEFMRRTMVTIDVTNEIAAKFIDRKVSKAVYESYMLPLGRLQAVLNGREVEAWHLLSPPPLYQYAATKRQLSVVTIDLLDAPLNNTMTTIPLKNYILTRIQGMKNPHNKLISNKILYSSIYEELGLENPDKQRRARIREYTRQFLEHLLQKGYITWYEECRSGRTIDSVVVDFSARSTVPTLKGRKSHSAAPRIKPVKPSEQKAKKINRIGKPET